MIVNNIYLEKRLTSIENESKNKQNVFIFLWNIFFDKIRRNQQNNSLTSIEDSFHKTAPFLPSVDVNARRPIFVHV